MEKITGDAFRNPLMASMQSFEAMVSMKTGNGVGGKTFLICFIQTKAGVCCGSQVLMCGVFPAACWLWLDIWLTDDIGIYLLNKLKIKLASKDKYFSVNYSFKTCFKFAQTLKPLVILQQMPENISSVSFVIQSHFKCITQF